MKKVKCDNGHFFDADRFSVCPICGSESFEELSTSEKKSTGTSKNTKALFALDGSVPHMSDSDGLNPPASSELIENIPAFEDPPLPPQDDSAPSTGTLLFSHEAKTPADLTQVDISQELKR